MHEYSLIQALLERVEREARAHQATRIHKLKVRLGEQAGVDPELFSTAYQMFRQGTLCEGAELEVKKVPARWTCSGCGRAIASGEVLVCPDCGAPAKLAEGDELFLDSIDMEVP